MTESIQIKNQNFIMHASGVLFWEAQSMLLISDVHLGKVSHFRKFGAAVPQKAIQKNFDLLNEAVAFFKPNTIVFMGDLFHSSLNKEWDLFEKWSAAITSKIILVSGNHDIISPLKYEDLKIAVVLELNFDGFLLTHHPEERDNQFNFAGHIHPAIKLTGLGKQSIKLPCFFKKKNQMILPAFGEFTGTYTMNLTTGCEAYALLGDSVLKVPVREAQKRNGHFK